MSNGASFTGKFTTTFNLLVTAISLSLAQTGLAADAKLSGDKIPTSDGDLIIHPVEHATPGTGKPLL